MPEWDVDPVEGVDVTYLWRGWTVTATWPTRTRNDIATTVKVEHNDDVGRRLIRSERRLNLLSTSGIDGIAVAMRRVADKPDIDQFLNEACQDLIGWYRQGLATVYPAPEQRNGAGWLVYPIWPKAGVTAVAAAGGSYKSFIAQAVALQLATGDEILKGNTSHPVGTVKTLYLDWEADAATFGERLRAISKGAGLAPKPVLAYKAMRIPLTDTATALAEEIRRGQFGAVVVDSMSAAAGGDLIDAAIVNGFYDAVRLLGVPALVLAHKSAENVKKKTPRFFGSIMSENRVRLAWNGEKSTTGNSIAWSVFKDNNAGMMGNRLAWRLDWAHSGEHENRRLESVSFTGVNPDNVQLEADPGRTQHDRITYALLEADGPLTTGELAQATGIPADSARSVLNSKKGKALFEKAPDGIRWQQRTSRETYPDPY